MVVDVRKPKMPRDRALRIRTEALEQIALNKKLGKKGVDNTAAYEGRLANIERLLRRYGRNPANNVQDS